MITNNGESALIALGAEDVRIDVHAEDDGRGVIKFAPLGTPADLDTVQDEPTVMIVCHTLESARRLQMAAEKMIHEMWKKAPQ